MTEKQIQRQIEVIHKASNEAMKSKESARQFLIDAGIIEDDKKEESDHPTDNPTK